MKKYCVIFLVFILCGPQLLYPQADTISRALKKKRLKAFAITTTAAYSVSLFALSKLWYAEHPKDNFHFFNDNAEWKQLDKAGHFYSGFHISNNSARVLSWATVKEKKANFWGSIIGFSLLTPIEILDGFSSEFGASYGDVLANASGSLFFLGQSILWDRIRVYPKFSFSPSSVAAQRPEVLGNGLREEFVKDYNGQTYWLSFDIYEFLPEKSGFPRWLNFAVGYGAHQLAFARDGENIQAGLDPHRQYYLSLDLDLSHIESRKKALNVLLDLVNLIHLPAPAIEFNRVDGTRFHYFFF